MSLTIINFMKQALEVSDLLDEKKYFSTIFNNEGTILDIFVFT